jgi:hypothetical protein
MNGQALMRIPEPDEPPRPPAHLRPAAHIPEWDAVFREAGGMCQCAGECKTHFGRCYAPGTGPAAHRMYLVRSLTGCPIVVCDACMDGRERINRRAERAAAKARQADEPTLF